MAAEDQIDVHRQLEVLQKKDWKELSLAEKRAGNDKNYVCPASLPLTWPLPTVSCRRYVLFLIGFQHTTLPLVPTAPASQNLRALA